MTDAACELTGSLLIDGRWVAGDGQPFSAVDPASTLEITPQFTTASQRQVDAAARAAKAAAPFFAAASPETRSNLLQALARILRDRQPDFVDRARRETGLPEQRLISEMARTVLQLELFAQTVKSGDWVDAVIDTADDTRVPARKPDLRRMLVPIGPVAVYDASNFPFAYGPCGTDTATAWAAGNPVVVKAHPGHPGVDEFFAQAAMVALAEARLPAGGFNMIHGDADVALGLVQHPVITAAGFTGSLAGGSALYRAGQARANPIPVYAEMGSVNPIAILPGALFERVYAIADALAASVTNGLGQFCTKPGLIFTTPNAEFTELLVDRIRNVPSGVMLNARIQHGFALGAERLAAHGTVRTLVSPRAESTNHVSAGLFQVDAGDWITEPDLADEVFGPSTLLVTCSDTEEMITCLETLPGQLTGTILTGASDPERLVRDTAATLASRVGRLVFNGVPTGVEVNTAIVHGGPWPATSRPDTTSVGVLAITRFARPLAWQDAPDAMLPAELRNANPRNLLRTVNGRQTREPIAAR